MPTGIEAALETSKLNRVSVAVTGAWYPRPQKSRWEGVAQASVPLVGIILCEQSGILQWARSGHRASEAGLRLAIEVTRQDPRAWIYAGVGSAGGIGLVQATTLTSSELPIILCHEATTAKSLGWPSSRESRLSRSHFYCSAEATFGPGDWVYGAFGPLSSAIWGSPGSRFCNTVAPASSDERPWAACGALAERF
jgi:hypothetical protein